MKLRGCLLLVCCSLLLTTSAFAGGLDVLKELEALKARVAELEVKLEKQEQKTGEIEGAKAEVQGIRNVIEERLGTLSIHGSVIGYYQGMNEPTIEGIEYENPNGAGFAADLELAFEPLPNGEFYIRIHAGEGDGADRDIEGEGLMFADVNTINDDNPGDDGVSLLEVHYTHNFWDDRFFFTIGKTEPVAFIDDNAFANDEASQFVGKPFVNDPVLDSEDEFAPIVAVGVSPMEMITLVALVQSSTRPLLEEDQQKGAFEDIFEDPLVAGQLTISPSIGGLEGNYRVYGWAQTYDHPLLTDPDGNDTGWGFGISLDQKITEKIGIFGRLGYHNEDVYEVPWFWSAGLNLLGMIPCRPDDEIGIGVAGLIPNDDLENDDTEWHLEGYYRIVLSEYFALTPDIQYVINPLGNGDNDDVFAGMIRAEFSF